MTITAQDVIAFTSLLLAIGSMISNHFLQREKKKLMEFEYEVKQHRSDLLKALRSIKGYQQLENIQADKQGVEVKKYRAQLRKAHRGLFDSNFLTPGNIDNMISNIESKIYEH